LSFVGEFVDSLPASMACEVLVISFGPFDFTEERTQHVAHSHLFDNQAHLSRKGHAMLVQASVAPRLESMTIPDAELGEKRGSLNENLL
jgi:hypothetical protein